jgi:hypothetical protein
VQVKLNIHRSTAVQVKLNTRRVITNNGVR